MRCLSHCPLQSNSHGDFIFILVTWSCCYKHHLSGPSNKILGKDETLLVCNLPSAEGSGVASDTSDPLMLGDNL